MPVAYGIDLGGYSTGTTRVVRAEGIVGASVNAKLIESCWTKAMEGSSAVADYRDQIHEEMKRWDRSSCIVVDVPMELQGLPHSVGCVPLFHWQLTQRAIDYALGGLPPLADRIGAAVARWRALTPFSVDWLGVRLFETYPAGSLLLSGYAPEGYKRSEACYLQGRWLGRTPKHRSEARRDWSPNHPLALLLNGIRARSAERFCCNDDCVDALLCALAGLRGPHVVEGEALRRYVRSEAERQGRLLPTDWSVPPGYRLLHLRQVAWETVDLS